MEYMRKVVADSYPTVDVLVFTFQYLETRSTRRPDSSARISA